MKFVIPCDGTWKLTRSTDSGLVAIYLAATAGDSFRIDDPGDEICLIEHATEKAHPQTAER